MKLATALGIVIGLGLTMVMIRAFYINHAVSRARKQTAQVAQMAMRRELAAENRRSSRRVARSAGRGTVVYYDEESGLREPPTAHFANINENEDLPRYELPPEYEAVQKQYRRVEDAPVPYEGIERHSLSSSSSSSSSSSPASSQHVTTPQHESDPPTYSTTTNIPRRMTPAVAAR